MGAPEALRAWRGKRTLRQAAELIGCDPSYLSLLENRKLLPGDRILSLRLHKVAGIPPESWDHDDAHEGTVDQSLTAVNGSQEETREAVDGDQTESPEDKGAA